MEYSQRQIYRLIEKFLEHEIGNKEKFDSIKQKIENNENLSDEDQDYLREKHEQLIAVDEDERLIQNGLDSIRRLLKAEVGDPKRLEELCEVFEGGNLLSKYDDQYLQEKLDDLEKIQNQKPAKDSAKEPLENVNQNNVEYRPLAQRPTGITILAILYIIGGIVGLIGAVSFQAMTSMMGSSGFGNSMMGAGYLQAMGGGITAILAVISIISLIIAWALLSAKSWGRTIVIVFTLISLVMEFVSLVGANGFAIVGIVLDLVVLYYMWRPHVIKYFGGKRYGI